MRCSNAGIYKVANVPTRRSTPPRDRLEHRMPQAPNIDGVLIQWGDRLFYPGNRVVKTKPQPKLGAGAARQRAAAIRERIEATVVRRAPQVMVKVTGGGRGMKAIAAHFRYISKNGRLDIEDERGETMRGKDALPELAEDWRFGGTLIRQAPEPAQGRPAPLARDLRCEAARAWDRGRGDAAGDARCGAALSRFVADQGA